MKHYFSTEVSCDQCGTAFEREEYVKKLASNTTSSHYICKKCGADYKLNNLPVWIAAVLVYNVIAWILSGFTQINAITQLIILLTSFGVANSFRQYISFFRLVEK